VTRSPSRPSGSPPPDQVQHEGERIALAPLAEETARRHLAAHPEDGERYGDLAREWAVHDMQYVISWAYGDVADLVDLGAQATWLARVLDARGYPVANLADCMRTAAGVVPHPEVADRLRGVAGDLERAF
jgi:hypothetical protein